jgi:hypothetical protein
MMNSGEPMTGKRNLRMTLVAIDMDGNLSCRDDCQQWREKRTSKQNL